MEKKVEDEADHEVNKITTIIKLRGLEFIF